MRSQSVESVTITDITNIHYHHILSHEDAKAYAFLFLTRYKHPQPAHMRSRDAFTELQIKQHVCIYVFHLFINDYLATAWAHDDRILAQVMASHAHATILMDAVVCCVGRGEREGGEGLMRCECVTNRN